MEQDKGNFVITLDLYVCTIAIICMGAIQTVLLFTLLEIPAKLFVCEREGVHVKSIYEIKVEAERKISQGELR
jgi:hypothetical protein